MSASRGARILVVLHDPLLSGASTALLRGIPLLEERGWEFAFWVPSPGPASEHLRDRGYEVGGRERPVATSLAALRQPPGPRQRLASIGPYLRDFGRFARSLNPDLVHCNSLFSFAEALTSRTLGLQTLLHIHDMPPDNWKASVARAICRRGAHGCFAASTACARGYASGGWSPSVVHEAAPIPSVPASLRARPSPFVVGTVGVLSRRKGTDVFVEAAAGVLAERDDIAFRLIGAATDPLDHDWAMGVLGRAREVGIHYQESAEVEAELRGWDAFALPSRRDPFPLAMLEAMALGLPVVGAAVDGIPEQLDHGKAGVLVPPEDADSLAKAILSLADAPLERRQAMGEVARDRVASHFDPVAMADGIEAIYRAHLR